MSQSYVCVCVLPLELQLRFYWKSLSLSIQKPASAIVRLAALTSAPAVCLLGTGADQLEFAAAAHAPASACTTI